VEYETVYEGVVKEIKLVVDRYPNYYIVTFEGDLEIKVFCNKGDLPVVEQRYRVLRCYSRVFGDTLFTLERIGY